MRVLYFLEPGKELNNPLFRLGTVRNHIEKEVNALYEYDEDIDVVVLCCKDVADAAKIEGLLANAKIISISQKQIDHYFKDYQSSSLWYSQRQTNKDVKSIKAILNKALKKQPPPDIIVCYEGCAPYLQDIYPNAAFINSTLGMLSRAPFPETGCMDPFGIYKNSYISSFRDKVKNVTLTESEKKKIKELRGVYLDFCSKYSPVNITDVRAGFDQVLLLSLQVSGYFAFNENTPVDEKIENQIDLMNYVLRTVNESVGIFVTLHGAEHNDEIERKIYEIQKEHANLIYNKDIQKIKWCSQYVLPYIDGVVTVSSSVGLQAALLNKHVFVTGVSHLNILDCGPLQSAHEVLQSEIDYDNIIHHLLSCYYYSMDAKIHNGKWLYNFFARVIEKHKANSIDEYFFDELYDGESISILIDSMRISKALQDIETHASHISTSRLFDINNAKKLILNSNVISFDVFDTLITRNVIHPNDVFDMMQPFADEVFKSEGKKLSDFGSFRNLRERAANRRIRKAKREKNEEILYKDIYEEIRLLTSISRDALLLLRKKELEIEKNVINVRQTGRELYNYALNNNKKVILISDMYLSEGDINFILEKNGFTRHEHLYVSSEYQKLKKTGTLYKVVIENHGKDILHFGDNHLSDVVKAIESGISAIHMPIITETYVASKIIVDKNGSKALYDSLGTSLMHGTISRKFYDNIVNTSSWFNGSAYRIGYEACGAILLAFTKWVIEQAIRDGTEHLYFLARDGFLVKEIYDKIASSYDNAPRSHYLLASRRCYNTANLKSEQDILDSISLSFSKVPLYKILEARYGISRDEIDRDILNKLGFSSDEEVVDIKRKSQLNKFKRVVTELKLLILDKAAIERKALLSYLGEKGLNNNTNIAVVDIGHNGSLQESLGSLLGERVDIGGYYFMTYHGAKKVYDKGFNVRGYLGEFEDNKISNHPYCKNVGMFEFLFLPAIPSFKRFSFERDLLKQEYVSGDESKRFEVIKIVHNGIMDFVKDI
ncbi:MAG: HAD family hydrolase, partial [Culicoidibacterales bacterium]